MKKLYIGLDVHKESISIGLARKGDDAPVYYGKCSSSLASFDQTLKRILIKNEVEIDEVQICYEAGPTGFVLVRHLLRRQVDAIVVAPSLIPRAPGNRVKTDRRDACALARLLRAGELKGIHIPDGDDEAIRDVVRARTDSVDDLQRTRARLGAFLLRNGHKYSGGSNWTEAHMRYLRKLSLPSNAHKIVRDEYLMAIDAAQERVNRFDQHLEDLYNEWEQAEWAKAIQGMKGFRLIGSMIVSSELGDITRFDHPRQLMGYLGLVSSEDSSGSRRRQGAITKCGNNHARWLLVEAAANYRHPAKVSVGLTKRQEGLSQEVRAVSWRAQTRLCRRYQALKKRGLHDNKVKVAIARELAGFLWEMAWVVEAERAKKEGRPCRSCPQHSQRPPTSNGSPFSVEGNAVYNSSAESSLSG